jgi:uncharacterized protein YecE (DUF72 family)
MKGRMKAFIGTSGWNYQHWKGRFYPSDIQKKDWFGHYMDNFNTVEINYSFYRWPSEKVLDSWKKSSSSGFVFSLKAPRTITHIKRFRDAEVKIDDFYRLSGRLGSSMGCHLFQAPPNFRKTQENMERLQRFLSALDARKKNVIEFREPGWWDEEVFRLCRKSRVSFCRVIGLGMPDTAPRTARFSYLRFHGKDYRTLFPDKDISRYAKEIKKTKDRVYAYFNNDYQANAVRNAKGLMEVLENA